MTRDDRNEMPSAMSLLPPKMTDPAVGNHVAAAGSGGFLEHKALCNLEDEVSETPERWVLAPPARGATVSADAGSGTPGSGEYDVDDYSEARLGF